MLPSKISRFEDGEQKVATSTSGVLGRVDTVESFPRTLPRVLFVAGMVGALAAFVLTMEKFAVLADPNYIPTCSVNPVLNCGSIMRTPQAEVFGFPNPLLGLVGFPVVAAVGAMMLAGTRPARWVWFGLQIGATVGVVFVHWLIFQSLYRIGVLCPYCMVVWAVTIPIFWYVTVTSLSQVRVPGPLARIVGFASRNHGVLVTMWLLAICGLVLMRFFDYWSSLVTGA